MQVDKVSNDNDIAGENRGAFKYLSISSTTAYVHSSTCLRVSTCGLSCVSV